MMVKIPHHNLNVAIKKQKSEGLVQVEKCLVNDCIFNVDISAATSYSPTTGCEFLAILMFYAVIPQVMQDSQ